MGGFAHLSQLIQAETDTTGRHGSPNVVPLGVAPIQSDRSAKCGVFFWCVTIWFGTVGDAGRLGPVIVTHPDFSLLGPRRSSTRLPHSCGGTGAPRGVSWGFSDLVQPCTCLLRAACQLCTPPSLGLILTKLWLEVLSASLAPILTPWGPWPAPIGHLPCSSPHSEVGGLCATCAWSALWLLVSGSRIGQRRGRSWIEKACRRTSTPTPLRQVLGRNEGKGKARLRIEPEIWHEEIPWDHRVTGFFQDMDQLIAGNRSNSICLLSDAML